MGKAWSWAFALIVSVAAGVAQAEPTAKVRAEKHYALSGFDLSAEQIGRTLEQIAQHADWRIETRERGAFIASSKRKAGTPLTARFAYTAKEIVVSYADEAADISDAIDGTSFRPIDHLLDVFPATVRLLREQGRLD